MYYLKTLLQIIISNFDVDFSYIESENMYVIKSNILLIECEQIMFNADKIFETFK